MLVKRSRQSMLVAKAEGVKSTFLLKQVALGRVVILQRECSRGRRFSTCAHCNEYETCELLKRFYSMAPHQYAKDKLDRIRRGLVE